MATTKPCFAAVVIVLCLGLGTGTSLAAPAGDFYLNLLHRGMSHVDAGLYEPAVRELRIAAFGLVNSISQFEIAEIYLTIAQERLGAHEDARRSAQRIVAAERIERRYGKLAIPATARTAFEAITQKLLSADEIATLHAPVKPAAQPPAGAPPAAGAVPQQPVATSPDVTTLPPQAPPAGATSPGSGVAPSAARPPTPEEVNAELDAAERALAARDDTTAAVIYRSLAETPGVSREALLRTADGAVRATDFARAVLLFARLAPLKAGEERYGYPYAVALFETGKIADAKRELAAALPYLQMTPAITQYREKIEGAAP